MADFTKVYVQRALESRLAGHGTLAVETTEDGHLTIVHQYQSDWDGRQVKMSIAQLRRRGRQLQLFWQRENGRWVRYEDDARRPFVGSLDACVREIGSDRWGCFWG